MPEKDVESIAKEGEQAEDEDVHEPSPEKHKQELRGVLAGMVKLSMTHCITKRISMLIFPHWSQSCNVRM